MATQTAAADDAPTQSIVGRVVNFVTGNSPKDKLTPKKVGFGNKAKAAASAGTDGTSAVAKISKPKRLTLGAREISRQLGLSLPLHVAARACQYDMQRLTSQTVGSRPRFAIHGRAAAVTTVAAIEFMAAEIYKSAIFHARKRGASTVSLLDVQRGIIVDPRLSRSLRYSRVAVTKSANPLGIVPGMMIGIKHKKKKQQVEEGAVQQPTAVAKKAGSEKKKKAPDARRRMTYVPPAPADDDSTDNSSASEGEEEEPPAEDGDAVDF